MTNSMIESLEGLSGAASEALESLEKFDYRQEVKKIQDEHLPLSMFPKTIRQIFNSVMRWCIPIPEDEENLPSDALLNADNIKTFTENLNITGDREIAHSLQFISIEPIQDVADEFTQLGLTLQARMLENACNFALSIRKAHNKAPFGASGKDLAPVQYTPILAPEELSEDERAEAMHFSQFCSAFVKDIFTLQQKQTLYNALKALLKDNSATKPHLVIMSVILLLKTRRAYKNPLPKSLNFCRETIFGSLGVDPKACHSYGTNALQKEASPTLYKYKPKAEAILKTSFGN